MKKTRLVFGTVVLFALGSSLAISQQKGTPQPMTFFVTSTGTANGADYGGLAGADQHCQALAAAVGAGDHAWHAYLSTQGPGTVNARERRREGPLRNAKGTVIEKEVSALHYSKNTTKHNDLTGKGT